MFYREAGNKDTPTLVLLHGFPSSSHMFRDLIPKLSDRFHVVAPDYIGFGYSDAPDTKEFEYTFDNLAEHVEDQNQTVAKDERTYFVDAKSQPSRHVFHRYSSDPKTEVAVMMLQHLRARSATPSRHRAPDRGIR